MRSPAWILGLLSCVNGLEKPTGWWQLPESSHSPWAPLVQEDPALGYTVVHTPVESCLSSVVLIIYVQYLPMLENLDYYKMTYGPYFKEVEFYVDGTWCDPRETEFTELPCYGPPIDRSGLPDEVRVIDRQGGGWLMQRSYIDSIERHRDDPSVGGYFLSTDDLLLNLGQLTRAMNETDCDKIWKAQTASCTDVMDENMEKLRKFHPDEYLTQAQNFYAASDEAFREQLKQNIGSPSKYCLTTQPDFLYVPSKLADDWARVSQLMVDTGMGMVFTFTTAIFGIAPASDMLVLRSKYLGETDRAEAVMRGMGFQVLESCWERYSEHTLPKRRDVTQISRDLVENMLQMHIIHPVKLSHRTALMFAQTVNPPAVPNPHIPRKTSRDDPGARPFWCEDRGWYDS